MTVKNIYQSFTYKMAAKASWHRKYVTVTLCIEKNTTSGKRYRTDCTVERVWDHSHSVRKRTRIYYAAIHGARFVLGQIPNVDVYTAESFVPTSVYSRPMRSFFSWSSRQHCPMEVVGAYAGPILSNFSGCTIFRGPPITSCPSPPLRSRSLRSRAP